MWSAERWQPLDLRRRGQLGPFDGELIVLHMIPKTQARRERYLVGRVEVYQGRTYLSSCGSTVTMAGRCKHYNLGGCRRRGGGGPWRSIILPPRLTRAPG